MEFRPTTILGFFDSAQKKYEIPYFSKNPGWAEQKSNFYYETLCEVSKALKEKSADIVLSS